MKSVVRCCGCCANWLVVFLAVGVGACNSAGPGGGGGGAGGGQDVADSPADDADVDPADNPQGNPADPGSAELVVDFDGAAGGTFAVARDSDGNEYSFRARQQDGQMVITEANVRTTGGETVKCSLDMQGRPIKLRSADNENADITYEGEMARVRYTSPSGSTGVAGRLSAISPVRAIQLPRSGAAKQRAANMQETGDSPSRQVADLRAALKRFEEVVAAIFDDTSNPARGTNLETAARAIARVASELQVRESAEQLAEVDLDDVPESIAAFAGQTFVLFEAEGFCVAEASLENELTFDEFGVLLTERDRNFILPDFSLGRSATGFTVNYQAGSTVDLTNGEDVGFSATVTPVFTGTQLDSNSRITIERRFLAQIEFDVDLFTVSTARAEQLFNAAFTNGQLSPDGNVLEFDLVLVDLMADTPVERLGRVRYYRQGSTPPQERQFACSRPGGEGGAMELVCPGVADAYKPFDAELIAIDDSMNENVDIDWFISAGFGYIDGPSGERLAKVVPTAEGALTVAVIISDLSVEPAVFELYECEVKVGMAEPDDGGHKDECEMYGLYGDGYCDDYCPKPDPDCEDTHLCDPNDFPGDGYCDVDCDKPDPDCDVTHLCDPNDFPNDGYCDPECDLYDPDCDGAALCDPNDFPGDGFCDVFCDQPDTDCMGGNVAELPDGYDNFGAIECLEAVTALQPGIFFLNENTPPNEQVAAFQWYVIGTDQVRIMEPQGGGTTINFFDFGPLRVVLAITRTNGMVEYSYCDIMVQPPAE